MSAIQKNDFRAFTLIEVMVVMAIISIMAGIAIVSFGNNRVKKQVEAGAREFTAVVREAQNYALTGKGVGVGAGSCTVTWSGTSYGLGGTCGNTAYNLKDSVQFQSGGSRTFTAPHAVMSPVSTVTVIILKSTASCSVVLSSSGQITNSCP